MKISIDPGHGQIPPTGAVGNAGTREDDVNLEVAYQMSEHLKKNGYQTFFIDGDLRANSNQGSRAQMAAQQGCSAHVAVHQNAADGMAGGFEAWYNDISDNSGKSLELAQMACYFCAPLTTANRGVKGCSWQPNTQAVTMFGGPCIIAECAFISNPAEEAMMLDYNWRMQMGVGLAKAVMQVFPSEVFKHVIEFIPGSLTALLDGQGYPMRAPANIVPPGVTEIPVRELIDMLKIIMPEALATLDVLSSSNPQGVTSVKVVVR